MLHILPSLIFYSKYGKECHYASECWGARLMEEFGAHPNLNWQCLFVLLNCIYKNAQVFDFTNSLFQTRLSYF